MFYQLPPVGNPVQLSCTTPSEDCVQMFDDAYQAHYFASGTAALAAAITAAIRLKSVERPEVILPAYACPDLISASVFAGAKPVLVDIEADRPWMNLEQLATKITANTVAIIAVHLFGILERLDLLRPLAAQAGALLIEDSAQAFSRGSEQGLWQGDLVILSFGRGKPVSLLGGGAVLHNKHNSPDGKLARLIPELITQTDENIHQRISFFLKAKLYNWMINPRLYWLPQSLPFLHLGETRYHPLGSIEGMERTKLSMLPANIKTYRADPMLTQQTLATTLNECDLDRAGIIDLPQACNITPTRRLLRYPLLVEPERRQQLYSLLHKQGLGPSRMYPSALPKISGLEEMLSAQGPFPAATSFAERILTLPTHTGVTQPDIDKIRLLISR